MTNVHCFFDPERVSQLTARGIMSQPRRLLSPQQGFVLNERAPRATGARVAHVVTHVIDRRAHVTITGPRRLPLTSSEAVRSTTVATEPRTALELAEACARLQRDNQWLLSEVTRLRSEVDRLTAAPETRMLQDTTSALDDAARRFSLLELD